MMGFNRYLGVCSVLKKEAWGLLEGLHVAGDLVIQSLQIECDSMVTVDAVIHSKPLDSNLSSVVSFIRQRLQSVQRWELRHSWRELNQYADCLAGLACVNNGNSAVVRFLSPSPVVSLFLVDDLAGCGLTRRVRA